MVNLSLHTYMAPQTHIPRMGSVPLDSPKTPDCGAQLSLPLRVSELLEDLARLHVHPKLGWGSVHFHSHTRSWHNSFPCGCRANGLASCWLQLEATLCSQSSTAPRGHLHLLGVICSPSRLSTALCCMGFPHFVQPGRTRSSAGKESYRSDGSVAMASLWVE